MSDALLAQLDQITAGRTPDQFIADRMAETSALLAEIRAEIAALREDVRLHNTEHSARCFWERTAEPAYACGRDPNKWEIPSAEVSPEGPGEADRSALEPPQPPPSSP